MRRNLNPYVFFDRLAAAHSPRHAFNGTSRQDFEAWQCELLPLLRNTLGQAPPSVEPNPELLAQWEEDGLIKQRWLIDVQPNLSATLLLYRPADLVPGERRPAILACHGHGPLGKDGPMGNARTDTARSNIAYHNYDYGLRLAKAGFITYAIDWLGFGERNAEAKPHYSGTITLNGQVGRDACNVYYLNTTLLGTTVLAMNLHDAARATDFVCRQPFVDAKRLGVMGLSLGGTMATWVALTDPRFTAADIICYTGPFYDIAYQTYNICGSQITPGLLALADIADVQGLLAPKPLLMEIALHDSCFSADHTQKSYEQIRRIYTAAGAADQLELDLYPGEHAWGGNKTVPFFRRHLQVKWQ